MAIPRIGLSILACGMLALPAVVPTVAAAQSPSTVAWRAVAALPAPVQGLAAIQLQDGSILAVGGDAMMGAQTRFAARYGVGDGQWQRLPDAPAPLDTPALLQISPNAVLVVAPSFAGGTLASPSRALSFDPRRGRWQSLPSCPVALYAPHLIRLNAREVFAGGGIGATVGAIFDSASRRWSTIASPVPDIATYTVALLPGGEVLLAASVAIDANKHPYSIRRAFALLPDRTWRPLARPPIAVDGAQSAALGGGRVLLAGGYPEGDDPREQVPPSLIYDAGTDRWQVGAFTGADHRGAHLVGLTGGRALLIGGHSPDGAPSAGCLLFDGRTWQRLRPLPGPWAGYALVALKDGSVLLAGGDRAVPGGFAAVADTILLPLGIARD